MKTVLAAIDFSPVSRAVGSNATELARAIHGRLVLVNVVQPPMIVTDLAPMAGEALQITAEVDRWSRHQLRRLQRRLAEAGARVETICEQGFPVTVILAHARRLEAEYIVLGSHGHTAFHDLVAGSVASGVLRRATCPVVVVPGKKAPRRKSRTKVRAVKQPAIA